ncbi:MAG: tetratricopeptide repeat protein [Nitrospirales bacterium]|nr:tetratricopeptide repeat protein [Nitrospirales bacterium]
MIHIVQRLAACCAILLLLAPFAWADSVGEYVKQLHADAEQGDPESQHRLGLMYYRGRGVPQDYVQALYWYRAAAEQGDADAQHNLGFMYSKGLGVAQDFVPAHMWANLATSQGDQDAIEFRHNLAIKMTPAQIAEAQKLAHEWKPKKRE